MQALALAFGELATNSLKYGALKNRARVRINGRIIGHELELTWQEEAVLAEARAGGQGLELMDRIVRASRGRIEREIEDQRFTIRATFPLKS